ncbi:MAG: MarR family transcriptional regulator [Oscillospiraceae bacterium]|nr:MarR family transcriptional regulator [Oscillospiraceae bacterium]
MERGILSESTIKLNKLCKTLLSCYRDHALVSLTDEDSVVTPAGLGILTSLYYTPENDTISSLADNIDVSKGLVSREVEKLRIGGYVTTTTDKNDRRIVRPKITEKAIPIVKRELDVLLNLTEKLLDGITEEEFQGFMKTCEIIQENIYCTG